MSHSSPQSDPNINPGFPIYIQLRGCQSTVLRSLPAGATQAEINAAAQAVIFEVARQQAECDAITTTPRPNPSPFFTNAEVYAVVTCPECSVIDYDGTLPWYITLDRDNGRLVFAVGIVAANTQAAADAQAQTFINNFKTTALASGKLTCVECSITTASPLPDGEVGDVYSQALTVIDTFTTSVWSIESGLLPAGLSLNSATGVIEGTPTTEESATFTVTVTSGAQCCSKEFTLEVEGVSVCPDWTALLWGAGSIADFPPDAVATFTPTNSASDSCAATATSTNAFFPASANNQATVAYNGSGCNCVANVNWSHAGLTNASFAGISVISALFGQLMHEDTVSLGDGAHAIPFALPDTGGMNDTITVVASADKDSLEGLTGTVSMTATIANV